MNPPEEKLHACDVLNWDQLCKMSKYIDPALAQEKSTDAFAVFAYAITKTGDEDERDRILADILLKATYGSRPASNEGFLKLLATTTKSALEPLRKFAKQRGVKLKKTSWW